MNKPHHSCAFKPLVLSDLLTSIVPILTHGQGKFYLMAIHLSGKALCSESYYMLFRLLLRNGELAISVDVNMLLEGFLRYQLSSGIAIAQESHLTKDHTSFLGQLIFSDWLTQEY